MFIARMRVPKMAKNGLNSPFAVWRRFWALQIELVIIAWDAMLSHCNFRNLEPITNPQHGRDSFSNTERSMFQQLMTTLGFTTKARRAYHGLAH
jgi:hypothetical protein